MKPFRTFAMAALMACSAAASARYVPESKTFLLETAHASYVFGVNENGALQNIYWGGKVARAADFSPAHTVPEHASFDSREGMSPEEYPAWGGMQYSEPCLKVTFGDGVRDLALRYVSHEISTDTLTVHLKDIGYNFLVDLVYQVYPANDIMRRQVRITNRTGQPVTIESAQSAVWHLPRGEGYRLSYLTGRWAGETQLTREPIHPGRKVLESRRGTTSHEANPWFAIDAGGTADEEHGRVWFGALGWSGTWKMVVEQTPYQKVSVTAGYNDFDFGYLLQPGESLDTPPFYAGYTDGGFGESSRILHRFLREQILPDHANPHPRPLLYNSWEATTFNVNEAGQTALAEKAAKLGVELFVMDDGWFGQRNDDHRGLGDWYVNPQKFPNGLGGLIASVNRLGMKFGLWVEPEMVNPDSDLYRQHPDWAMHFPGRPRTEGRNQLILNMARDDVREHIFGVLDRLVSQNNIAFLKWDMNRNFSEPGWPEAPAGAQKEIWVKYVNNVYAIIDRLRAKHPGLEIESCSGGGGRVDLGMMSRVDEVWTSDNTEAFDRLRIQDGFSAAYAPKVMMAWVTDVPNMNGRSTPLKFRFLVAMMGSLGIGANLNHWSEADFALATQMVGRYKTIRATVQQGRLYRLASPVAGTFTANQYVSEDGRQAVLFAFLQAQQLLRTVPPVCLRGLDPNAVYRIRTIDDKLADPGDTISGAALMNRGLNLRLVGDFDSTMLIFERVGR
ncbi:MAG: alpha-galactosidase [Bryobacteraceae bacterium]|jgi:alpha-galactosidase